MPLDQFLLLAIGLILIAAVAVAVAVATSTLGQRAEVSARGVPRRAEQGRDDLAAIPVARSSDTPEGEDSPRRERWFPIGPSSTRQVARVVAFLLLAAVAAVVALSGAWPENEAAIFTLLAAGTLLVVLFMDMLPAAVLGAARRPLEALGAIVFLGLLVALTGGSASPFLVGFFLVVAGSALSTEGLAPLIIALVAAMSIGLSAIAVAGLGGLDALAMATVGFSAVALILLADIASAAARSQRQARDEALRASRFDALTGLYNRAFFFTTMEQEIRRSDRMGRGFTLLMLDLDDFKPINDTFGHQAGDRMLRSIADVIRDTIRFTDSAARYGGDEFVVLLPETDVAGGFVVGEKLRRDIAVLSMRHGGRDVRSSVSVGLVAYPADGTTIEQLVAAADVAMYESKRRGKNRIVGYQTRTERVATDIDADSARLVQLAVEDDTRTGGDPAPWGASVEATPLGPSSVGIGTVDAMDQRAGRLVEPDSQERAADASPPPQADEPQPGSHDPAVSGDDRAWLTRSQPTVQPPQPPALMPESAAGQVRPAADTLHERTGVSRTDEIQQVAERPWIALPIEPYDAPGGQKR